MIQTSFGPVGLRRPRAAESIKLRDSKDPQPRKIGKNWLKKEKKKGEDGIVVEDYRLHIKQAMLLAAAQIELQDLACGRSKDPSTGMLLTGADAQDREQFLKQRLKGMKEGTAPVPMKRLTPHAAVHGVGVTKHVLMKRSQKLSLMKTRWFTIDSGYLKVFKNKPATKPRSVYRLNDVRCRFESSGSPGVNTAEPFPPGYTARVCIQLQERPHGPLYLYGKDPKEAKAWERAVKMSKYMQSASDREALAFVVGRVGGTAMTKGWGALFNYYREISETRRLVKNLAMRLMRVDLSRGWTKAHLVYRRRLEVDSLKQKQQEWAARFLKEKMERISNMSARSPKLVRASVISQVQTKFRHYRQEKIFDRAYPLGSSVTTRVQQAQTGQSLGAAFRALARSDCLRLTMGDDAYRVLAAEPEVFSSRKPTYSEVVLPLGPASVSVSESFAMLSFSEIDEEAEHSHLAKGGWAHFINLDQISSVVLHSERIMNTDGKRRVLNPSSVTGVWFTINGPRVCWCRRIRSQVDHKTKEEKKEVVGATNGLAVANALAKGERVRWFKVAVTVRSSSIPKIDVPDEEEQLVLENPEEEVLGDDGLPMIVQRRGQKETRQSYMVLHLLGRQFRSERVSGDSPRYPGHFEADVPISYDEQALAALDDCEVGVDIVEWSEDPRRCVVAWAGKLPLWRLFGPEEQPGDRAERAAERLGLGDDATEELISLAQSLRVGSGRAVRRVRLVHAMPEPEPMAAAWVELEASAMVKEAAEVKSRCLSPELQGRGPTAALFSSHRSAWYDPRLGRAKFLADHVANFVEIAVNMISFPAIDKAEPGKLCRYQVEARLGGVSASTFALHRPREVWSHVIPSDPTQVDFKGARLHLPLPPGAWWSEAREERPWLELFVLRCRQSEAPALSFREFLSSSGRAAPEASASWERVYHGLLSLDGLLLDQSSEVRTVALGPAQQPPPRGGLFGGGDLPLPSARSAEHGALSTQSLASGPGGQLQSQGQGPVQAQTALLQLEATLRDRDFVQLRAAGEGALPELGQEAVLCVADKCMLSVEEPLSYPLTELEFRRRFLPGEWDRATAQARQRPAAGSQPALAGPGLGGLGASAAASAWAWTAPLREPSMSHEYAASGLERLENPPAFRQRYIPTHCEDVIPHRFVLPQSELDFLRQGRPGLFWRAVDDLVNERAQGSAHTVRDNGPGGQSPPLVVTQLSHLVKHVPCTLLAVYGNQTCDLELAPIFVHEWERHPEKRYCFPGAVVIKEFVDTSAAALRSAPVGAGDVGERFRRRCILREVPLAAVTAVQPASFNVYDCAFSSVDEAVRVHPADLGNDFNPCMPGADATLGEEAQFGGSKRGGYCLHAGPLPADAGPSCQYEWSLHLHAESEDDMYHFISALRQAVRLGFAHKLTKLDEYRRKSAQTMRSYNMGPVYSSASGHLEVVLVEARHLRPHQLQGDKDLKAKVKRMTEGLVNSLAIFKMRNGPDGEELVFRGSKTQWSAALPGNSPNWSKIDEVASTGGWVFKSPVIEPSQMPKLYFELDMMHNSKVLLGVVRVPTAELCNRDEPFHNMWVPLCSAQPETGELVPNLSGEVHLMTLWVPSQPTGRAKRLPKTARGWLMHGLRPKLRLPSLRDPVYGHEVRKAGYNPNCAQNAQNGGWPKKLFEANAEHVEAMAEVVPYLDCCEKQSVAMWKSFRDRHRFRQLQEMGVDESDGAQYEVEEKLGQWRRHWAQSKPPRQELLHELDELLRRGVPPGYRRHLWQQVTYTDLAQESVQAEMGSFAGDSRKAVQAYKALVDFGRPYRNEAILQLQEDLVGAAAWENASANPHALDIHMQRLKRAEDVCIALIIFSMDYMDVERAEPPSHYSRIFPGHPSGVQPCGVAYCESLLILAFFLLLAQGKSESGPPADATNPLTRTHSTLSSTAQQQEQADEDEARTFWLLYTLVAHPDNMAYRDYFGVPEEFRHEMHPDFAPMSDRRGAMDDVYRLGVCVARYERDLWVHLAGLGLHLSVVFYRAFMHLFAFLLPTPSLFRFWDLLFSESARPDLPIYKPPRHSLIDLAFGVLRGCKQKLLQTQSATEARDCILSFLESLYDPSAVVELATDVERYLWDDPLQKTAEQIAGIAPMHISDYNRHISFWEAHLLQFRVQNCVLRELSRDNEVALDIKSESSSKSVASTNQTNAARQDGDPRLTTRKAVNHVIPILQKHCMAEGVERNKFGGMLRQTPLKIRELGPELDQSLVGTVSSWFAWATETIMPEDLARPMAYGVPPPPNTVGEPTALDHVEFGRQVQRSVGTAWNSYIQRIYESFASPLERRLSLNEFFIALICCSKGTVGEKAMALFHLYASAQPLHRVQHIVPVTHNAATVVERIEGNARRTEAHLYKAPSEEEVKRNCALHFRVFTHGMGNSEVLLGEAFVPNLGPYRWNGIGQDVPQAFSLWGMDKRLPPGVLPSNAALDEHGVRPCIGELSLAVKWIPSSEATPDVGQLGLHLHSVYLNPRNVETPKWKNPRVTVVTYDDKGNERPIKRWDPRSNTQRFASHLTAELAYSGAFGEHIEWQETMYRDTFGMLHPKRLASGNVGHGWDPRQELWQWSQKWGDQYSMENFRMRKELIRAPSQRPNSISLKACRLITEGILRRGLACVTNRQAVQISDQIFNRAGAVPGILDAVVVQGTALPTDVKSISQLRAQKGVRFVDVKHQLVLAFESQVSEGLGSINFFPPSQTGGGEPRGSLASIKIQDPFAGEHKLLWMRIVRSGDGQRVNEVFKVEGDGSFSLREVSMDMEIDGRAGSVQMTLTKEEFVSCVLSNPILSETLRRLSTTDNSNRRVPEGQPIKLDVAIADPTHEEADEDFMDAMNVRQAVLLEVWDHDSMSRDDFLGECWLPPLSDIGPHLKHFVLPVRGAPSDQDGDTTRPDSKKRLDKKLKCTGDLFIEASWVFPAQEVPEGGEEASPEDRAKQEEMLHTGRLHLKILKAETLRAADSKGSDPYVRVYLRNETFGKGETAHGFGAWGWHVSRLGAHEAAFETKSCRQTTNPEWNEECQLTLRTGSFERRALKAAAAAARRRPDDASNDNKELRLHFGVEEGSTRSREPGHRHGVEVLLGDTLHSFRRKLRMACEREAGIESDPTRKQQFQLCGEELSSRHAVMVFVPSPKLRELHQQSRDKSAEYRKLYKIEEQDPSSWQPLDPIRTFHHYAAMYGFGHPQMSQRLRVAEGTDDFRLRNNRFRLFEQEQARWAPQGRPEALDSESACFGYAQFSHPRDAASPEWRPALVERLQEAGAGLGLGAGGSPEAAGLGLTPGVGDTSSGPGGPRRFRVNFLHAPLLPAAVSRSPGALDAGPGPAATATGSSVSSSAMATGAGAGSEAAAAETAMGALAAGAGAAGLALAEEQVLLAPANPRLLGSGHLEHQEFLARAGQLHDDGVAEKDIVQLLNSELRERWQKTREVEEHEGRPATPAPPPITLSDVRSAIVVFDSPSPHPNRH